MILVEAYQFGLVGAHVQKTALEMLIMFSARGNEPWALSLVRRNIPAEAWSILV
jgi:hypothetical protein